MNPEICVALAVKTEIVQHLFQKQANVVLRIFLTLKHFHVFFFFSSESGSVVPKKVLAGIATHDQTGFQRGTSKCPICTGLSGHWDC